MIKTGFSLIQVPVLALAVFAGGAKDAALYTTGTYTAAYDARDSHGWKPVLEIVIEKGKIVSATFDYVNAAGKLKSQDEGYATMMKSISGTSPAEASAVMVKSFIAAQNAEIDDVAGATHSTDNFRALARAILEQAKTGNTQPVVLSMNDTYTAEDEADERGYKAKIMVTYENGRIVKVVYDEFDKDGNPKRTNEAYNTSMKAKSGTSWTEAAVMLEAALVSAQTVDGVDTVTGATHETERFKSLAAKAIGQR